MTEYSTGFVLVCSFRLLTDLEKRGNYLLDFWVPKILEFLIILKLPMSGFLIAHRYDDMMF